MDTPSSFPSPVLQRGPRVLLRAPTLEDALEFTTLARRSRRFHAGLIAPPRNAEQFATYLARNRGADYEALLLCRSMDGAIVGAASLSQIFRGGFQNAYLGYWIGISFSRRGYMREGLGLVLRHAFRTLGLHRIEANIQPENLASRTLVERLGFRLEGYSPRYLKIGGRWRDHERWAILREEWKPPRGRAPLGA